MNKKRAFVFVVIGLAIVLGPEHSTAQYLINPGRTASEPLLFLDSVDHIGCGVRFHNLVKNTLDITDYDVQIVYLVDLKENRASTFSYGTVATITPTPDGVGIRNNNPPIDLYFFIEGVSDPIRLTKTPVGKGTPIGYIGGPVIAADAEGAVELFKAVVAETPILAHFRIGDTRTMIVRIVSDMTLNQDSAFADCLKRIAGRTKELGKQ